MAKRQREWARRTYDKLILQLGGKCVECGSLSALTIDHIEGCDFDHNKIEWSHRVSIYRREALEGKLQVLCEKCNSKKGRPEPKPDDDGSQFDLFTYLSPSSDNEPF